MIGAALLLASLAWQLAGRVNTDREGGQQSYLGLTLIGGVLFLIGLVIGPIVQLAVSRSRESLADAAGVQLAGEPTGLISALTKLEGSNRVPAALNHATAGMFIDNPHEHHRHWLNGLFDTHPPIERRIADLEHAAGMKVTAIELHERLEDEIRREAAQAKAAGRSDSSDTVVQVASVIVGIPLTVVVMIFNLWAWYLFTLIVLVAGMFLGLWLSTAFLRLSGVIQFVFITLVVLAGFGVEGILYLTGLWVWVVAGLLAVLVGGFLVLCFGHEVVAFLSPRHGRNRAMG